MHQPDGKPSTKDPGSSTEQTLTIHSPLNAGCARKVDKKRSVLDLRKRRATSRLGVECVYASPGRGRLIHLYYFCPIPDLSTITIIEVCAIALGNGIGAAIGNVEVVGNDLGIVSSFIEDCSSRLCGRTASLRCAPG